MSNEQNPFPQMVEDVYSARVLGRLVTTDQGILLTIMAHMADMTGTREFIATYEEIGQKVPVWEDGYTGADFVAIVVPYLVYKGIIEREKIVGDSWRFRISDRETLVDKVLASELEDPWEELGENDPDKWELDAKGHRVRDSVRNAKTALAELRKLLNDWEGLPEREEDYEYLLIHLRDGWEVDWSSEIQQHIGYNPTLRAISVAMRGE